VTAAVRCLGLVKQYPPNVTAVDGLELEVEVGECMGLLGPNGAGKTTTVEMIEGLTEPTDGTVQVFGQTWKQGGRTLRQRLGVQLQDVQLVERLSVAETLGVWRSFFDGGNSVDQVIEWVGLGHKRDAFVMNLSGGQKQRVALGCALVGNPDLLCLDEPTTGLDPQARRHVWEIVEQFQEGGGTVLLTTHYMEEAARLCDRVAIVDAGKVIALGTPKELIARIGAEQIVEMEIAGASLAELGTAFSDVEGVTSTRTSGDRHVSLGVADIAASMNPILSRAAERGWEVASLSTHVATLEDVFVTLTGKALRE